MPTTSTGLDVEMGGIYRAAAPDPRKPGTLVLVTAIDEATRSASVTLLSPDVEFGGSGDIPINKADSGLPYDLLAQSDIFGSVWLDQLDRRLGQVSDALLAALAAIRNDDPAGRPVAGPPIIERTDPRWTFKENELRRLQVLTTECTTALV